MSLSSSNRQIISRCIGSSSTTSAVARKGFDCPIIRLPEWVFINLTGVKAEYRFMFGSNLRKMREPALLRGLSVFSSVGATLA
jgi:hypothetical protein